MRLKKTLITEEQYIALLESFVSKPMKKIMQTNYYYDTNNYSMLKSNETLRIRQIENCLELQFKHNKKIRNGARVSKELSKKVEWLPKNISVNGIVTNFIGFLITERISIEFEAYTLFFDKNYYLGKVDYEIEIETAKISDMPKELFGVTLDINCSGKYTRFISELLIRRDCYEISR